MRVGWFLRHHMGLPLDALLEALAPHTYTPFISHSKCPRCPPAEVVEEGHGVQQAAAHWSASAAIRPCCRRPCRRPCCCPRRCHWRRCRCCNRWSLLASSSFLLSSQRRQACCHNGADMLPKQLLSSPLFQHGDHCHGLPRQRERAAGKGWVRFQLGRQEAAAREQQGQPWQKLPPCSALQTESTVAGSISSMHGCPTSACTPE